MRISRRILFIVAIPITMCLGLLIAYDLAFSAPERNMKQALHVYANATPIWEAEADYGASSHAKQLYYWTEDPLQDVQRYYESYLGPFLPKTLDSGAWLDSVFYLDLSRMPPKVTLHVIDDGAYCKYYEYYECVVVALVKADQDALYEVPFLYPGQFKIEPMPAPLAAIPKRGTLIIYRYYAYTLR
jgi:hypothetical protein